MSPQERYDLIQEAMRAFNPFYRAAVQAIFPAYEIQGRDWFYAYLAYGLEPGPLTADLLHEMTPYANSQSQAEWLRETAENGFLEADGANSYRLTAAGRFAPVEAFFRAAYKAIANLQPLPAAKMDRLARIDQYLDDLNAFRDDAHLATFAAYAAALDDLAARGWVKISAEGFAELTAEGIAVRETAEKQTGRYFFRPWLILNQADSSELTQLLISAKEQLRQLARPEPSLAA